MVSAWSQPAVLLEGSERKFGCWESAQRILGLSLSLSLSLFASWLPWGEQVSSVLCFCHNELSYWRFQSDHGLKSSTKCIFSSLSRFSWLLCHSQGKLTNTLFLLLPSQPVLMNNQRRGQCILNQTVCLWQADMSTQDPMRLLLCVSSTALAQAQTPCSSDIADTVAGVRPREVTAQQRRKCPKNCA
jgi:hypothetical protein